MISISVLMPVYNGEKFLKDAIESILNQTFKDFELIIINDGSSDNPKNVLSAFNDTRIKYFENEINRGIVVTLNKGIELSVGKYIVRHDQDDISLPDRFEKQFAFMENNPDIAVCGTYLSMFGSSQNVIWKFPVTNDDIVCNLLFSVVINHPTVIMRREFLNQNNFKYDEEHNGAEDYDLWVRIAKHHKLANLPEALLLYRIHSNQMATTFSKKQVQLSKLIRKRMLNELMSNISENEFEVHNDIAYTNAKSDTEWVKSALKWLAKLKSANDLKGIYPEPAFRKMLADRALFVCFAKGVSFSKISIFMKSDFLKYTDLFSSKKIKLALDYFIMRKILKLK